jgi:hypothetical protein
MKRCKYFFPIIVIFTVCLLWSPSIRAEMVKEVCIGVSENAPSEAAIEADYLLRHGPSIVDLSGPWLSSYKLWLPYDPPDEAVERFGALKGRYAELWYTREMYVDRPGMTEGTLKEDPSGPHDPGADLLYVEKRPVRSAVNLVPAKPTETFYTWRAAIDKTTVIRWVTAIMYPEGVSVEDGEDWFLNVHAREACEQPGLLNFFSYRVIDELSHPSRGETRKWVRINEYWYKDFDAWCKAVIESPPKYTKPSWGGEYPFVEMRSTFIPYVHYVDFLEGGYIQPRR